MGQTSNPGVFFRTPFTFDICETWMSSLIPGICTEDYAEHLVAWHIGDGLIRSFKKPDCFQLEFTCISFAIGH